MEIAIIGLILFFAAGAASVLAIGLRNMPQPTITLPAPPRMARVRRPPLAATPKTMIKRDSQYAQERNDMVRILLVAGKKQRRIAAQFRGNRAYNLARVKLVAERIQQTA